MKKALGLSFFDKVDEIPRCLDPIWKEFDYIIAIDGRYKNYETDHDYSNDGSYELIEQRYPNAIMDRLCAFQPRKRQRYLDIAGSLGVQWLIVIDTDEYIHPDYNDWPLFWRNLEKRSNKYPDHKLFKMKLWIPSLEEWPRAHNIVRPGWKNYVRIHKDPGSMRYCMQHHYYWSPKDVTDEQLCKGEPLMYAPFRTAIDGVRLATDSSLRSEETLRLREQWAHRNVHDERRMLYYMRCDYQYNMKHEPLNDDELYNYGKRGKIVSKKIIKNQ